VICFIARQFVEFSVFSGWINIHPLGVVPDDVFYAFENLFILIELPRQPAGKSGWGVEFSL